MNLQIDLTDIVWISLVIAWGSVAILTGWVAGQRGRSVPIWMVASLLFGPLAILAVGLSPIEPSGKYIPCTYCREPLRMGATLCPHCGSDQ